MKKVSFEKQIIGRGFEDYFSSKWNLLDFFVVIVSLAEMTVIISDNQGWSDILNSSNKKGQIAILKNIRLVRFVRLLRWARVGWIFFQA